jgi:four helix bundle protein
MPLIKKFEDLECWQESRKLFAQVFNIASNNPIKKEYAIRDQLIRCSLSISNNIAEGFGRISKRDFLRFLVIANGSALELKNMIYLMFDIGLINLQTQELLMISINNTQIRLKGLMRYLNNSK